MMYHPPSSRSWHRPLAVVRSTLFIITLAVSTLAQAHPVIVLNTPGPGSVTSCTSFIASWTILQPVPDDSVQTEINSTYIGIWATNVDVDQTAIQITPTNPNLPVRRLSRLSARQQVVAAPITTNVTIQGVPLTSGTISGGFYTWTPVRLPPNQYYVMHLQSLPGHREALDISVKSEKFFVSEGASDSCLDGIVQSITFTSSTTETALPSGTSTPNDGIAGENNTTSNPSNKNRTGAIAGGVIGGLGLLGLVAFLVCFCLKRRKSDNKEDLGDFLATRGVNPYGRRSLATIEGRVSSYEPTKYGGILAAIGIHPVSSEKEPTQTRPESRHSGSFYPRRFSYQRQPEDHLDGAAGGNRTSFSRFRSTDVTDMATILAADPAGEEKSATRRSKSSSITTFAQSAANVPYHPYNSTAASEEGGVEGVGRRGSQRHKRGSSLQMQRASEGYAMSPMSHASGTLEETEPQVMAWTGPSYKRASTAMSGGEPRSSGAEPRSPSGEPRSSEGGPSSPSGEASGEARSSESGELGALTSEQGAPLARRKSATSGKSPSTKASVTRKKAPDLPLPKDGPLDAGITAPPTAYLTPTRGNSTTTVNTGASAYAPSQATRDRRSADLMTYQQNGRRSSEVFGPGTSAPGQGSAFDAFAGAKEGPVHILMPDLPPAQAQ